MRGGHLWMTAFMLAYGAPAVAQTCLGRASFEVAPYQVSGGAAFTDGANGFEAGFAGGNPSVFAGATLGRTNYTEIDESSTDVGGFAGGGPALRGGSLQLCGLGGIAYRAGPSVGALETHSVSFAFGAALGIVAIETATYSVVPAFGGGVTIVRLTARIGDEDETESETFGTVDFGVGFIFNRRVSVTPRIAIPVGGDSNDPVFGFSVAVNFGR